MPKYSTCPCGGLKTDGKCDRCKPSQRRQTTAARGYDNKWRKLSERVRQDEPLCRDCANAGRVTPCDHVHHQVPISVDPSRRLDRSNLVPLCEACHEKRHSR